MSLISKEKQALEEQLKLTKAKYRDNSSLEMLRGRLLDKAKSEIEYLRQELDNKLDVIDEMKIHVSQAANSEVLAIKDAEIEKLNLELTRAKIQTNSKIRNIEEI